ncbi:MAG: pyridoxal phosphate-dependent aminotransferase family protein [Enterobacterales bacterium]|nr:pyridoxal phosphate-dependent aminotransferase family protein [Enterobacterales bacterium]
MDGARYSDGKLLRYRHNDPSHLELILKKLPLHARKLVITDSIFSMSGKPADIPAISAICKKYGAILMVDECHSMFILGKTGGGIVEYFNLNPDDIDIVMATLSKAIPASGGYIASSRKIINYLKHESRGFIYSIALPTLMCKVAKEGINIFKSERAELARKLAENTRYFSEILRADGIDIGESVTPIVPILIGDSNKAALAARKCQDNGLFIHAVFAPVVPQGQAILRASITAAHKKADLFMAARKIGMIVRNL